jgi:hypothetical protein
MSRGIPLLLLASLAPGAAHADGGTTLDRTVGVNLTADEPFGARQAGMAVDFAAFQQGAEAAATSPAAMNDVNDFTFATAHAERFGRAQFDDLAFILPFAPDATLGLAVSRFGASDIEWRPEDTDPKATVPRGFFNAADYVVSGAFSRRWSGFDLGFSLDLLYRHLDQDGLGLRGDAMAQYTWNGRNRLSVLAKGVIPSSAHWESGFTEYEVPDLYLGGARRIPVPYFYGTLEAAFQTEGLFGRRGKSQHYLSAGTLQDDPMDLLAATHVGFEFLFDFGMAVRAGLTELSPHALPSTASFGIGYSWRHILGIDYSFTPHPDLLSTHRISLQLTPAFPKLDGRGYRPHAAARPRASAPETVPEEQGVIEDPQSAPAPPSASGAVQPQSGPAAAPGGNDAPKPAEVKPAAPTEEILDSGD